MSKNRGSLDELFAADPQAAQDMAAQIEALVGGATPELPAKTREAMFTQEKREALNEMDKPGVRPHPSDPVRFPLNPGKTLVLAPGKGDAVKNESEYVTEWCIKILPPAEALATLGVDGIFGVRAQVSLGYYGEQFYEYQPCVNSNYLSLLIPLVGVVVGVHGRMVQCRLDREAPSDAEPLNIQAAIVPGRPSLSVVNRALSVAAAPTVQRVAIPTFSTRFSLFGTFTAGDTIHMQGPSGSGSVQTITLTAEHLAGQMLPIHPLAAFIEFLSGGPAKELAFAFEVIS